MSPRAASIRAKLRKRFPDDRELPPDGRPQNNVPVEHQCPGSSS
jgi:hypothetical protein